MNGDPGSSAAMPGRVFVFDIQLPEAAAVELAVVVSRQLINEVDRAGTLEVGEALTAPINELGRECRRWVDAGFELDDRLDFLAPLMIGDADGADVSHRGMGQQDGVDFR